MNFNRENKRIVYFVGVQFLIDLFDEIRFVFDEMLTSRFQPNQCWFYSHKKLLEIDERIFQIKMTDGIFSKMSYHKQWNTINFERARASEREMAVIHSTDWEMNLVILHILLQYTRTKKNINWSLQFEMKSIERGNEQKNWHKWLSIILCNCTHTQHFGKSMKNEESERVNVFIESLCCYRCVAFISTSIIITRIQDVKIVVCQCHITQYHKEPNQTHTYRQAFIVHFALNILQN